MSYRPSDLVFKVPAQDADELMRELSREPTLRPALLRPAGADGGGDIATILVSLAPPALSFLAGVVSSWIAHRGASVEIGTIKVRNVSRKAVERILRDYAGDAVAKPAQAAPIKTPLTTTTLPKARKARKLPAQKKLPPKPA